MVLCFSVMAARFDKAMLTMQQSMLAVIACRYEARVDYANLDLIMLETFYPENYATVRRYVFVQYHFQLFTGHFQFEKKNNIYKPDR